jgi:protein-S-isoprenylcysteine O-methyltransferase Ste14
MLVEQLRRQGNWLFRQRSWLPLLLLPVVVAAITGESLPAWVMHPWWQAVCAGCILLGLLLRGWIAASVPEGTSGRNTAQQQAERLNTTGAYALVRHPLYAANFLIWSGILLRPGIWWLWALGAAVFAFIYERIALAEEEFLEQRFGEAFRSWARRTPAFLPRLHGYCPPEEPFRWGQLLRREYSTWLSTALAAALVEGLVRWRMTGAVALPPAWWVLLGAVLVVAAVLRLYKALRRGRAAAQ